jgi:hypothetical protein
MSSSYVFSRCSSQMAPLLARITNPHVATFLLTKQQSHLLGLPRFASSAAMLEEVSPKRRRTLETKNPIILVCVKWAILIILCSLLALGLTDPHDFLLSTLFFLPQTERAAERVKELLEGEGASGALGIRLGVKRRE